MVYGWQLCVAVLLYGCSLAGQVKGHQEPGQPVAFPGAEGFGSSATGGRGGKVFIVEHLADEGPGSFREAAEAKGKRIIVFEVAGTIHLQKPLRLRGDVTIAGQTAPGDGICIADHPVMIDGDNVIIRFMRFRLGDRYQGIKGKIDGSGSDDALQVSRKKHVIIDHCSLSWSTDEVFSIYGGDSSTVQWCIIAEPLNYSYHFEKGDTDWEHHGYGGIWGGAHLSAHHNLFLHCESRTPRFNGARLGATTELVDFRNNVIYNWGKNNVYGGEGGRYNIVANYYKPGPNTSPRVAARIVNPSLSDGVGFGRFFVHDNVVWNNEQVSLNNKLGVHAEGFKVGFVPDSIAVSTAFVAAPVSTTSAQVAYPEVLKHAGTSLRRDTLDKRLIQNVEQGTGNIIDVQGGFAHGTPYTISYIAWPALKTAKAATDTDRDGMPDNWEKKHNLNSADSRDAQANNLHAFYTNIEVYINSIAASVVQ